MSSSTDDRPGAFHREYQGGVATLRSARRDVVEWLTHLGAGQETKDRAALIVSELTSNAIQAAPRSAYKLQVARVDEQSAAISVSNRQISGLPPAPHRWRAPTRSAATGDPASRARAGDRRLVVGRSHRRAQRRIRDRYGSFAHRHQALERVRPLHVVGFVDDREGTGETCYLQQALDPLVRVDQFVGDALILGSLRACQDGFDR